MSLEQQIQKDIMEAMKAKQQVRLEAVRAIKAAILLAKTSDGAPETLEDADIIKIIQKLAKQRRESAEQYMSGGRKDLADNELAECEVLETYLPKQLSPEELEAKLKEIVSEVGASSMADMGKVMGVATKRLAGLADGKAISAAVKVLLG